MPLRSDALLVEAALSLDYLFDKVAVSKALDPTSPKDFNVLVDRLARTMRKRLAPFDKAAVTLAMKAADVDWKELSVAQTNAAVKAINAAIAKTVPPAVIPTLTAEVEYAGSAIVDGTKKVLRTSMKLSAKVKYDEQDKAVVQATAGNQGLYVTDEYGRRAARASDIARNVVGRGLETGLDRYAIGEELNTALAAMQLGRSESYFDMLASVYMNRARSYAQLSGYAQAEIEHYRFDAVMDAVTTLQCRFMHGRVFEVQPALKKHLDVASGAAEVETAQPWLNTGRTDDGTQVIYYKDAAGKRVQVASVVDDATGKNDETGTFKEKTTNAKLQELGISVPPLHGRCRSTITPE